MRIAMPYFHVRVTQRSMRSHDAVELDLSEEDLMRRFVRPYREGRGIAAAGRPMAIDDIEQIKVSWNEGGTKELWQRASAESYGSSLDTEWYVAYLADDVTNQYITGPPGEDAPGEVIASVISSSASIDSRKVFVVHGRDKANRDALFSFLRAIDLDPIEWSEARRATGRPMPYIGDILDKAFSMARAVVVLLTPDDEARLRESFRSEGDPRHETDLTGQARPNVLFEAGMAMGRHPERTILVECGKLRPFTDIAGLHVVRFDGDSTTRQELAHRLEDAGCQIKLHGTDWHTAGEFSI